MSEAEARDVIRRMFALMPAARAYYEKNVPATQKTFVFATWVKVLTRYSLPSANAALESLATVPPGNTDACCYPVQFLVDEMKAKQPRPKQDISPCDRSPRDSNMLESYLAGVAAREQPLRLQKIIEGVL